MAIPTPLSDRKKAFSSAMREYTGKLNSGEIAPPADLPADDVPPSGLVPLPDPDYEAFGTKPVPPARPLEPAGDVPSEAVVTETTKGKLRYARNTAFFTRRIDDLVRAGFDDPMQVLMEIASGFKLVPVAGSETPTFRREPIKVDGKTRAVAASELLGYIYPKRKSVEVSAGEGAPLTFNVVADQSAVPQMPSDAEIEAMAAERRRKAAEALRVIDARDLP